MKKAQEQEKLRLRRGDWNQEPDADVDEPGDLETAEPLWNADFGAEDGEPAGDEAES